jgi:hypothetical protein
MKPKHSPHATGKAAYTRSFSTEEGAESTSSSEETNPSAEPQDTTFERTNERDLMAQEQQMIEEKFPEDPTLSIRLYGRGRDTEMVRSSAVGENIDVTG